jgi:Condensation domain
MYSLSKKLSSEQCELIAHLLKQEGITLPAPATPRIEGGRGENPLSYGQQRLWFLHQIDSDIPAYNMPLAVRVRGDLNVSALNNSINQIIKRHGALRTTFASRDGEPIQVIAPELKLRLEVVDLSAVEEKEREEEMRRRVKEEVARRFDLNIGPLIRAMVVRMCEGEHVVAVTMHHIISDGWSLGVFIKELCELYEAECEGRRHRLEELRIQYGDYARWQRAWLQGEELERQIRYWREQLRGRLPILKLENRPRLPGQTHTGKTQPFALSKTLSESLRFLSRQEHATLFMTLLAGFNILLHYYSGEKDIIVGTDVANRNHAEIETLIGFFVNQIVLRSDLSGDPTFRELLSQVREITLGAYTHQDLPFEEVVDILQLELDSSRTPLIQIKLVMQEAPLADATLPGLTLYRQEIEEATVKFDLLLNLLDRGQGLVGALQYNTDLFDVSFISHFLKNYEAVLHHSASQPDARLSGFVTMLANTDRERWRIKKENYQHSRLQKLKNVISRNAER